MESREEAGMEEVQECSDVVAAALFLTPIIFTAVKSRD